MLSIAGLFFYNVYTSKIEKSTIIILSGPSSSGKSSIAKKLEEKLGCDYLKIGADEYTLMLLPQHLVNYNPTKEQPKDNAGLIFIRADDEKGPKLIAQVGTCAKKVFSSMSTVVAALAHEKNNIIVDAGITADIEWVKNFIKNLKPFKVYFIKVFSPLQVLEQRERDRNGLIGLARGQLEQMESVEKKYNIAFDLCVDTSKLD